MALSTIFGLILVTASPAAERPEPSAERRGVGFIIAAGGTGAIWLALKASAGASDLSAAADVAAGFDEFCAPNCFVGPTLNGVGAPFLIATMASLGTGTHRLGAYRAHRDLARGASPRLPARVAMGVGGALLAAGAVVFVGTQAGTASAERTRRTIGLRELGWWFGGLSGVAGAGLVGYGHGQHRINRKHRLTLSPAAGRSLVGLRLRGAF